MEIKSVTVIFADGSKSACEHDGSHIEDKCKIYRYRCREALVNIKVVADGSFCILGFSAASLKNLNYKFPLEIEIEAGKPSKVLALTTHKDSAKYYAGAFGYYNQFAIGKEPRGPKPPDNPDYPPKLGYVEHEEHMRGYPCWAYPVLSEGSEGVPYYSIFMLANYGDRYMALLTLTDKTTAYLGPGLRLRIFSGKSAKDIELSWIASISVDKDPYRAVENCVNSASSFVIFKPRRMKKQPTIMEKIGWCSWNALLTDDLSHENIIKIVSGLLNRGLRIGWVMIDDGWQDEVRREGWPRRILRRLSSNERFPEGIRGVVNSLKGLGVGSVGLWHTINIHWSGFEEDLSKELGVRGYFSKFNESYVPPPNMNEAFEFYRKFFSWVKSNGVNLVKVDNQWVIHALYHEASMVGESAKNVELSMQAAAYANGLEVLNCMSMVPEDYSNFLFSNIMRVSMDYIPFWKADAKLHTIFSSYNALLFSHMAYPDYDMFMSYDPYAKVHAVARVFSGGPVYITDREPDKTDIELLKRFVLPDGSLTKVDSPALPTSDVLFRDPYNEHALLKLASEVNGSVSVAAFNVNKMGEKIEDSISLNALPFPIECEVYAYYKVFSDEYGLLKRNEKLNLSLGELDVEVVNLVPVKDDKAVIGLKEYLLPRSLVRVFRMPDGRTIVESLAQGTLLYYADGAFNEVKVKEGSITKI
ncbi:raffinose synthase [Candidatus Bathyarchaeota archaeon]|nr:raffinose synthase [Candidatus Bathyarchaeota archaeon]